MSINHEAVEITPYLNPNYWDGHSLGVGEASSEVRGGFSLSDSRYARKTLNTRIRHDSVVPLETFRRGEVFNPTGYEPGTVILFRQESLYGDAVESDYEIEELMQQPMPERLVVTSPSFDDFVPLTTAKDDKRSYLNQVRWGVVPRDNDKNYISSTMASAVRLRGASVRVYSPSINTDGPIAIGETRHWSANKDVSERLDRINILHVIAYGVAERKKQRFFSLLGKPALGHIQ